MYSDNCIVTVIIDLLGFTSTIYFSLILPVFDFSVFPFQVFLRVLEHFLDFHIDFSVMCLALCLCIASLFVLWILHYVYLTYQRLLVFNLSVQVK